MKLLEVKNLSAGYGSVDVLRNVDLDVDEGSITVILGANGAGKTTLLRSLSNLVRTTGEIVFAGKNIAHEKTHERARIGIAHVPQGRGTFPDLTVAENLAVGAYTRSNKQEVQNDLRLWLSFFPRLNERQNQLGGKLSGGEQQMLAIARALMLKPRLLLLDEPSLGLSPLLTQEVFQALKNINQKEKLTILLVEQNAHLSLAIADKGYVLETGSIAMRGSAAELLADNNLQKSYLGI